MNTTVTLSPQFAKAAASSVPTPSRAEIRASETITEKGDRIAKRAETHFEKQRPKWVAARFDALMKKDAPAPALRPRGMPDDKRERLLRAASHLVDRKQHARMHRISRVIDRHISRNSDDKLAR
jgi:hypothetical protein